MTRNDSRLSRRRAALIARVWPLALTISCASLGPAKTFGSADIVSHATMLTAADLHAVNAVSTLDAVQQLRPDFLRASPRADRDATGPVVYLNGMYIGDVSWLAGIQIAEVRDVTFLHPTDAFFRFGSTCRCGGGVVSVQTRQGKS